MSMCAIEQPLLDKWQKENNIFLGHLLLFSLGYVPDYIVFLYRATNTHTFSGLFRSWRTCCGKVWLTNTRTCRWEWRPKTWRRNTESRANKPTPTLSCHSSAGKPVRQPISRGYHWWIGSWPGWKNFSTFQILLFLICYFSMYSSIREIKMALYFSKI